MADPRIGKTQSDTTSFDPTRAASPAATQTAQSKQQQGDALFAAMLSNKNHPAWTEQAPTKSRGSAILDSLSLSNIKK